MSDTDRKIHEAVLLCVEDCNGVAFLYQGAGNLAAPLISVEHDWDSFACSVLNLESQAQKWHDVDNLA